MRILLGVHQFFPHHGTGTEVLTLQMAQGLRRRGHEAAIVTGEPNWSHADNVPTSLSSDSYGGLPVYRVHFGPGRRRDPISLHLNAPDRVRLVLDVIHQWKPDVVHLNHLAGFSGQVVPAIGALGVPVVFTATDYWPVCSLATLRRRFDQQNCQGPAEGVDCVRCLSPVPTGAWLARLGLMIGKTPLPLVLGPARSLHVIPLRAGMLIDHANQARLILCSTRFLADVLVRHGADDNKVRVLPYGVDVGPLPEPVPIPDRFTPEQPLRLGFIGSLVERKGSHVLLEALRGIGEQRENIRAEIYGNEVPNAADYYRRICAMQKDLGPVAQLKGVFLPTEIGRVLRGLHALVVPSTWYESAPLSLCSALAAGVPVIVSRLGGLTEPIVDGQTGLSFPPGDAAALGNLFSGLVRKPNTLAGMRRAGESSPRRTIDDYVADAESIYHEVLFPSQMREH